MSHGLRAGVVALLVLGALAPGAPAVPQAFIQRAVNAGVAYLRRNQHPQGSWDWNNSHTNGVTALAAMTLLECGARDDDPAVLRAANFLRLAAFQEQNTYSIALMIMFFDRLNDPDDVPFIQVLTGQLLGGQTAQGGWSYSCPGISQPEAQRLLLVLHQRVQRARQPRKADDKGPPRRNDDAAGLAVLLQNAAPFAPGGGAPGGANDDNSNTQFATLALWVSRRHKLPVDRALAAVEFRFRNTQVNGGWTYSAPFNGGGPAAPTPSMTGAGLLGLAVGYGATQEAILRAGGGARGGGGAGAAAPGARDLTRDPVVRLGLATLGTAIGGPLNLVQGVGGGGINILEGRDFYFLWTLERVAVVYDLQTLGGRDWYAWGSDAIVRTQFQDGSWRGGHAGIPDTCFALLFLRRANLARDLTSTLKGKLLDPDELRGAKADKEKEKEKEKEDPPKGADEAPPDAEKLTTQLLKAAEADQAGLVTRYRDAKGVQYTQALAGGIPQLTGKAKEAAREALAERLARMTALTLRDKMADESSEIRRAAALACAVKDDRQFVPDLIPLLEDTSPEVPPAARASLKSLTNQDFGPPRGADPAERKKAAAQWKAWWDRQKK